MIILAKPYVSEFLIETLKRNNFKVLDNKVAREYFSNSELVTDDKAISLYKNNSELFYSNSENSIEWVANNLPDSHLARMISTSKDKIKFRKAIKSIFPNYYFKSVNIEDLKTLDTKTIPFPVVLKPSVGFLSFGVYPINNEFEWQQVILNIDNDIAKIKGIFPQEVVDMTEFIIEEMIQGEEYAVDAYFDKNGEATILNIFNHPFFNDKDVSDRAYFTSKGIMLKYLDKFKTLLDKIGKVADYKNFPFHLELRVNGENIIPIEINPMRMCGWCITDIAQYAWGINVYECFFNQIKPDWDNILKNSDDSYYYFTIGDIPSSINRAEIKNIDFTGYLSNISNPLDIRKIDYKVNPIFAIIFAKTNNIDEIKNILNLDMSKYINL